VLSTTEYLLMSAILLNANQSYGKEIYEAAESLAKEHRMSVSYGSLYPTLRRLSDEKLVTSEMGEPTPSRGGKARRLYTVTGAGRLAMREFEAMAAAAAARVRLQEVPA
jgi:PadR family transcriptional regulator, regulatory protein PadR